MLTKPSNLIAPSFRTFADSKKISPGPQRPCNLKICNFQTCLILVIDISSISNDIALKWMPQYPTDG